MHVTYYFKVNVNTEFHLIYKTNERYSAAGDISGFKIVLVVLNNVSNTTGCLQLLISI